jgi:hypothetical protein
MALRKNRTEILDKIITKAELGSDHYCDYWDDDDYDYYYWDCDNCGKHYCNGYECVCYEYLPEEFQPKYVKYVSKRGIRVTKHTYSTGRLIDLNSVYPKDVLRQKRINHILGVEKMIGYSKTTIGDVLEYRK